MIRREVIRQWGKARFGVQKRFNEAVDWALRRKTTVAGIAVGIIAVFFMFSYFRQLFLMALFTAIGAFSLLYNRFVRTSLGIELITLGVVITGRLYGPYPALSVGLISLLLAELLTGSLQHKTIISFAGMAVIGLATQLFTTQSITAEGIWLTVIYDAFIAPGYLLLGSNPVRTFLFLATHIAFNVWLFTTIAPLAYRLVS
ncbi:hypothetical protein HY640_02145 [Candidatus Woesearchaeota archaeon]|nr:hypothetical protein [Candidatus Woesearchaeota archaeon]